MANTRTIALLLLVSLAAFAQPLPFTQSELGWDYRYPSVGGNSLTNGLLAYYKFEQSAVDSTGNHNLSTNGLPLYDVGKILFGYTPTYGITDPGNATNYFYLATHTDFQLVTNRTFVVWLNILDTANDKLVFGKEDILLGPTDTEYRLIVQNQNLVFEVIHDDLTTTSVGYPDTLVALDWNFIVAWIDAGASNIFLQMNNGTIVTNAYTSPPNFNTNRFRVGDDGTTVFYENHDIDEMGIWNRILTPAERTNLWNSGVGLTYPFQ